MTSQTEIRPDNLSRDTSEQVPLLQNTRSQVLLPDSEEQIDGIKPSDAQVNTKQNTWNIIWKTVFGILLVVFVALLIKGLIETGGGGFDWEKTFKKALGGGLSGAAGLHRIIGSREEYVLTG
jgi:hypothetical protein